ncbi:NAD-dependent histone deacetylase Sir2p [Trichomonascus vanleenenianus]|uniref:NAD-dependent histone deacetylase Sir2p n=1 Tax=Trichomonascus vanleenenianus TaxID=2268995 RepID=UPI003ECA7C58
MRPFKKPKTDDYSVVETPADSRAASVSADEEAGGFGSAFDEPAAVISHVLEKPTSEEEEAEEEANKLSPQGFAEESSSDESEGSTTSLNPWQQKVLSAMEDCLEDEEDIDDSIPRVRVSPEQINEIRDAIKTLGPYDFLFLYALSNDDNAEADEPQTQAEKDMISKLKKFSAPQVLAAIGFPLPLHLVDTTPDLYEFTAFIPTALRHFSSARRRLPYPKSIEDLVEVLESAQNVLVLTGAGISTSLGIPDFRSQGSGLYSKLEYLGLGDPQEVFDIRLFREDPSIFYSVAKEILPAKHGLFTPTHAFIKLLQDQNKLLRNYTQNIDNLEANAGIDHDKVVQCHGSFASVTCLTCGYKAPGDTIFESLRKGEVAKCPVCSIRPKPKRSHQNSDDESDSDDPCYGVLKPDITFFGEALPDRFDNLLLGENGDAAKCDLVICIGTSLKVAPVSEIIRIVKPTTPQIYINKTSVTHNEFDITFSGGCDDVVEWIAQKMSWPLTHSMAKRRATDTDSTFPDGRIEHIDKKNMYKFVSD